MSDHPSNLLPLDRRIEIEAGLPASPRHCYPLVSQQCALLGQVIAAVGRLSARDTGLGFREASAAAELVLRRHAPRQSIVHDLCRHALTLIEDRL